VLFLLSIVLSLLIVLPISRKCEIRFGSGFLGGISIGVITAIVLYALSQNIKLSWLQVIMIEIALIVILAATVGIYKFYRDPQRVPPKDPSIIVSPADGRVLYVKKVVSGQVPYSIKGGNTYKLEELTNTSLLNDAYYTIGIMMTILDVHVNRTPIKGQVIALKHTPGQFMSLRKEQATVKNERLTTVIEQGNFKVAVVQIASRLVRRIQSYLEVGQGVELAQRLGMIKFGSQVDLVIPRIKNLRIDVMPGDEVKAGVSVLARYD